MEITLSILIVELILIVGFVCGYLFGKKDTKNIATERLTEYFMHLGLSEEDAYGESKDILDGNYEDQE